MTRFRLNFWLENDKSVIPFETEQKLTCLETHRPDSEMITSFLTILYEDLLIGEQVDVQATVHEGLLRGEQVDVHTTVHEGLLIGEQVDVQTTVHEGLLRGEQADV